MGTPASGTITLNEVHVEAGGSSGSQCSFNDSDIRSICNSSVGSQFSMSDMYERAADFSFSGTTGANSQSVSSGYAVITTYTRGLTSSGTSIDSGGTRGSMSPNSDSDYFSNSANIQNNIDKVLEMFPALKDRQKGEAGYLSGGEQQMLAIGRALMSEPEYLLLDEPSLGLAPKLVDQIAELIQEINNQGVTVLLVEQNANMALNISDHGYIMETGNIVMDNDSEKLLNDEDVREFYLGLNAEGTKRKSFKEVKHYKRKKRWLS